MSSITVIILTKNEEKNIELCITSAQPIAERIVVVDCGSTDRTVEIAKTCGADVFTHEWPGHAAQFNWALENCGILSEWVLRLDADERISAELAQEIPAAVQAGTANGYEIRFNIFFMGKELKHGGMNNLYVTRLFRFGKGKMEESLMDERFLIDGEVDRTQATIIHQDYKDLDTWVKKHIWYSELELKMYREQVFEGQAGEQKQRRRFYYRLPMFFRARLYYWYRYYFQMGFLDGREGKIFAFLQAYWFRFLVDAKIYEQEKK